MKWHTVVLSLLVILSLPALADSGHYTSEFSNPQPFHPNIYTEEEHPDVVMEDEFVSIVLGADGAVVNAEFTFRNEGAAQTVPMYFPLESSSGMFIPDKEYGEELEVTTIEEITDSEYGFRTTVNKVATEVRVLKEETLKIRSDEDGGFFSYDIYAIYEVPFSAGETLTLRVEYQQQYDGPKHADWWEMYYPIHTGGSWKGPIGHGIVEVTAGSDFDWNGVWQYWSVSLPTAREKNGKLIWEFDELEPELESRAGVLVILPLLIDEPCWGIVVAESGINFRSERNNTSARVATHTVMKEGEYFTIFERQGDWWRIEDEAGNSGWLRWRYVDGDKENIYAAIAPGKSWYHALESGG